MRTGRELADRTIPEISQLCTNLLTVTNGQSLTGGPAELPPAAPRDDRSAPRGHINAYRSPYIPAVNTKR
jgi:hypothetical protein